MEWTIKRRDQRWVNEVENGGFSTDFDCRQFRRPFRQISMNTCSPKTNRIPTSTQWLTGPAQLVKNWCISIFWRVTKEYVLVTMVSQNETWAFLNNLTEIHSKCHHHMIPRTYLMDWEQEIWLIAVLAVLLSTRYNKNEVLPSWWLSTDNEDQILWSQDEKKFCDDTPESCCQCLSNEDPPLWCFNEKWAKRSGRSNESEFFPFLVRGGN